MCIPTKNLKLCSCASEDELHNADHIWELYRYVEGKMEMVLGEVQFPSGMSEEDFKVNHQKLAEALKRKDLFDFPVELNPKDKLRLIFKYHPEESVRFPAFSGKEEFFFTYTGNYWRKSNDSWFIVMGTHDEAEEGKIEVTID
ncbi:hypothetical protein [Sanyastnella coralliicola]|uniref:hypothetical protein n=1 Tax=Sanyastnella coralliicola TaxID=3069118 RepID=UPI0027B8F067|nr:hypothetical protein [Longitalea sp. SCSIO 12813]